MAGLTKYVFVRWCVCQLIAVRVDYYLYYTQWRTTGQGGKKGYALESVEKQYGEHKPFSFPNQ